MISREKLLTVMESRFDYYSARAILGEALSRAGLPADKGSLDARDLRALGAAVGAIGPRTEGLVATLNDLAGRIGPVRAAPAVEIAADEPAAPDAHRDTPAGAPAEAPADAAEGAAPDRPKARKKK